MDVLFISSGNKDKGLSSIVKSQGESLRKSKINVAYYSITDKGYYGYFKHILLLRKFLKLHKFDILHAHYGLCGIVSFFAKRQEKLIVSFMGDDLIGSPDSFGKYTAISKILSCVNVFFARRFYDFNIVKSQQLSDIIGKSKRVSIIPNGVNFTDFKPLSSDMCREKLGLEKNKKYILFASNPDRIEKNYKLAKEAVSLIMKFDTELLTVHNVNRETLNLFYNAADVLLLTSHHEGSPNVIKEAMACNCPIVSVNVGDVKEVIKNVDGCFIALKDASDIAEKLTFALEFMSRTNGRQQINNLEDKVIAEKIKFIYNKILNH